jgi:hypothetical protein
MQLCGKHVSAAVNQNTIEEAVFSVGAARIRIERVIEFGNWQNN